MVDLPPCQTLDLGLFTHLPAGEEKVAAMDQPDEPAATLWLPDIPLVPQMPPPAPGAAAAPRQPDIHVVPVLRPAEIVNIANQPPPHDAPGQPGVA